MSNFTYENENRTVMGVHSLVELAKVIGVELDELLPAPHGLNPDGTVDVWVRGRHGDPDWQAGMLDKPITLVNQPVPAVTVSAGVGVSAGTETAAGPRGMPPIPADAYRQFSEGVRLAWQEQEVILPRLGHKGHLDRG